jgi:hypothetical protein
LNREHKKTANHKLAAFLYDREAIQAPRNFPEQPPATIALDEYILEDYDMSIYEFTRKINIVT